MKSDAQNTDAESVRIEKKLSVGDVVEIEIKDVAHGGHFVAHHGKQVIFVRHAITGEKVKAKITRINNKIMLADTIEVLQPSKYRVTPPCEYVSDQQKIKCGGCDFQHINIEYQRELKEKIVVDQFYRLAKFDLRKFKSSDSEDFHLKSVAPATGLGWRTRMNFAVSKSGKMGMFPHHSNEILEIKDCQIADSRLSVSKFATQNWSGKNRVSLELFAEQVQITHGDEPGVFWQSHINAQETLTDYIGEKLIVKPAAKVLDLYSGLGVFGQFILKLQPNIAALTLVDTNVESIKIAKSEFATLLKQINPAVKFNTATSEVLKYLRSEVQSKKSQERTWDLAIVDPPRSGLNSQIIDLLAQLKVSELVYISCDPASLARDFAALQSKNYHLNHIRSFDLFPMTQHIETVAIFGSGVE